MRKLLFFILMIAPAIGTAKDFGISAIVNDQIISRLQVEERLQFVIATTGLVNTQDTQKRLLPQIMRALIDESLQLQAAKSANIRVSDEEVSAAVGDIERQRGKPSGSLLDYLTRQGVNPDTFLDQVRAQIAWNKLVSRRIGGRVAVSSDEIKREIELKKNAENLVEEARISSFLLPVDKPENEQKVQALANRLKGEIERGASLEAIASQLGGGQQVVSDSWVDLRQLDPAIAARLRVQNSPGVLEPLRTGAGYHVIRLSQKRQVEQMRDAELLFKEIGLSLNSTASTGEVDVLMSIAREVAKNPGYCRQKGVAGIGSFEGLNIEVNYRRARLSSLSPAIIDLVKELRVEQVSEPFATPKGLQMLMLCEKIAIDNRTPDRSKIQASLLKEKVDIEAMRYLRDLRREAFVEVRG